MYTNRSVKSKNCLVSKTNSHQQLITISPLYLRSQRHFTKISTKNEFNQNFLKLIRHNETKCNQKIYKRCRSSESTYEGKLNKRSQFIFLTLPYQSTKFIRQQFCKKMWRKLIICVQSIIFFFKIALVEYKIRSSSPPKMSICHQLTHFHPYPESPTNRKRKKEQTSSLDSKHKNISFGEKIQTLIILQKLKQDAYRNQNYLKQIKNQDFRLTRLIGQKAVSSHSLHSTVDNSKQLPQIGKGEITARQSILSTHTKKFSLKFRKMH